MTHVMIDIETLGTEPGAAILSIGAVVFGTDSADGFGEKFYVNITGKSNKEFGMTADIDTCMWWFDQSPEARAALKPDAVSLDDALDKLKYWLKGVMCTRIWANSPSFDLALLKVAYQKTGIACPWRYSQERDFRTVNDLVETEPVVREGTHHNALDDAIYQATVTMNVFDVLE